ncbi:hypothetical protein [Kitasatospora sp. NPDC001527]|uniref:hypothetical protein n=1 Tax=Kitasatospora sp. NPDC001527 TaxID=3154519 RepID=UPI00332A7F06
MATVTRHTISVHRLVQTVLRTTAPPEPDGSPTGRHATELALLRPLNPEEEPEPVATAEWDALMPHLVALAATRTGDPRNDHATALYRTAAERLHGQGHSARAIPFLQALLRLREQVRGDTHLRTQASRRYLAAAIRRRDERAARS